MANSKTYIVSGQAAASCKRRNQPSGSIATSSYSLRSTPYPEDPPETSGQAAASCGYGGDPAGSSSARSPRCHAVPRPLGRGRSSAGDTKSGGSSTSSAQARGAEI